MFINSDANRRIHTDPSMFINQLNFFLFIYLDYDPRTLYVPEDYLNSITPVSYFNRIIISIYAI